MESHQCDPISEGGQERYPCHYREILGCEETFDTVTDASDHSNVHYTTAAVCVRDCPGYSQSHNTSLTETMCSIPTPHAEDRFPTTISELWSELWLIKEELSTLRSFFLSLLAPIYCTAAIPLLFAYLFPGLLLQMMKSPVAIFLFIFAELLFPCLALVGLWIWPDRTRRAGRAIHDEEKGDVVGGRELCRRILPMKSADLSSQKEKEYKYGTF